MSEGNLISISDLPVELREQTHSNIDMFEDGMTLGKAMDQFEGRVIVRALVRHKTLLKAARSLGIHPTTLWRKMTKFGILKSTAISQ
jgi:transcriptional regulator with PAS, ATPase and Fis domain